MGGDLALPQVHAHRTRRDHLLGAYVNRVQTAGERHPATAWRFLQVASLTAPPIALFGPSVLWRAMTSRKPPVASPARPAEA